MELTNQSNIVEAPTIKKVLFEGKVVSGKLLELILNIRLAQSHPFKGESSKR